MAPTGSILWTGEVNAQQGFSPTVVWHGSTLWSGEKTYYITHKFVRRVEPNNAITGCCGSVVHG